MSQGSARPSHTILLLQGDHIKTWRRRWFILKQGYMFRFATPDVSPSTKPRGLVDLSKVSGPFLAVNLNRLAFPLLAVCVMRQSPT